MQKPQSFCFQTPQLQKIREHDRKAVLPYFGAGDGNRTRTALPPRDFKSLVSTSSTTPTENDSIINSLLPGVKSKAEEQFSPNEIVYSFFSYLLFTPPQNAVYNTTVIYYGFGMRA